MKNIKVFIVKGSKTTITAAAIERREAILAKIKRWAEKKSKELS